MHPLRDYQLRADAQIQAHHAAGRRRVLCVAPTGAGKSLIGLATAVKFDRVLWLAHRRELVRDAAERLTGELGALDVGIIAAGLPQSPFARVQVSSIQTLLRRDSSAWPEAQLVIFDEAHHAKAEQWSQLLAHYPNAQQLLLTATPERQDGKPMGDMCDALVVAADYSELLAAGHLVPIRAYRPTEILGSNLAQDPVDAWERYSDRSPGFAFFATVALAHDAARRMVERGIRARVIEQGTDPRERAETIAMMHAGELDCICNVYTMTEGIDIPCARVCMLASAAHHCGGFLQKAGRVLRPHPSKRDAILIDLVGASILHGLPTENRIYSLDGKPIERTEKVPLKTCLACGAIVHAAYPKCPECGVAFPRTERKGPKIWDMDLVEVFAGENTPEDAKRREYARLRALQKARGFDLYFVQKSYKELFGVLPIIHDASDEEKREAYAKLQAVARARGFKPGFPKVRYRELFGAWPRG